MLNVTTLNGRNEINGFKYPVGQAQYTARVEVYKGGALVESGTTRIDVFEKNFARYESTSYLINAGQKASFNILIKTLAAHTANGKFIFRLPTTTYIRN